MLKILEHISPHIFINYVRKKLWGNRQVTITHFVNPARGLVSESLLIRAEVFGNRRKK